MIKSESTEARDFPLVRMDADLVVVGGGLSGICSAITAAREGLKVVLVQDRSVIGGNASSEVRLWVLGATSHMGNNNRWAREGGVIDELLVENMFRNPEGNPVILDNILLDKVTCESNIRLLLNTAVYQVRMKDAVTIGSVKAYCSQSQTEYILYAPLFSDASGDGVLGFLSGAAFRMGAEAREEFGELFAPSEEYGELLGHSLYFYSKDTHRPVRFIPPSFALQDITKIPRFKSFNAQEFGCRLWWIEYGGRMDTVHDTEEIKWELWKIVYGVWNYIKNSGKFPEAETLTLEWVGMIPGKRESRRFEGAYMLRQQDITEQRSHFDAVGFGGWSIDLHPSDGVYSEYPGCNQWHSKGIYQIPFRCLYSKNISNLFLAGRIISASHVAFGSCRVMATGAYLAQASAMGAVLCRKYGCNPADLLAGKINELQERLIAAGQHVPNLTVQKDNKDLVPEAEITATSELMLAELEGDSDPQPLDLPVGQMIPMAAGRIPEMTIQAYAEKETLLHAEIRICSRTGSYTPDEQIAGFEFTLQPGKNCLKLETASRLTAEQYIFVILHKNPTVSIRRSHKRITGILSVFNTINPAVSNYGKQEPPEGSGMDSFEFWCPQRRPAGHNIAIKFGEPLDSFRAVHISNGVGRPTTGTNAWVADFRDAVPALILKWKKPVAIKKILLGFDTDFDHPMESVLMSHPERVMPFCVRNYRIYDDEGKLIAERRDNYQTTNRIELGKAVLTSELKIELEHPGDQSPAALFSVRCYS
jgi:hypothetical protein